MLAIMQMIEYTTSNILKLYDIFNNNKKCKLRTKKLSIWYRVMLKTKASRNRKRWRSLRITRFGSIRRSILILLLLFFF